MANTPPAFRLVNVDVFDAFGLNPYEKPSQENYAEAINTAYAQACLQLRRNSSGFRPYFPTAAILSDVLQRLLQDNDAWEEEWEKNNRVWTSTWNPGALVGSSQVWEPIPAWIEFCNRHSIDRPSDHTALSTFPISPTFSTATTAVKGDSDAEKGAEEGDSNAEELTRRSPSPIAVVNPLPAIRPSIRPVYRELSTRYHNTETIDPDFLARTPADIIPTARITRLGRRLASNNNNSHEDSEEFVALSYKRPRRQYRLSPVHNDNEELQDTIVVNSSKRIRTLSRQHENARSSVILDSTAQIPTTGIEIRIPRISNLTSTIPLHASESNPNNHPRRVLVDHTQAQAPIFASIATNNTMNFRISGSSQQTGTA